MNLNLFGEKIQELSEDFQTINIKINPLIKAYGLTDSKKCKTCDHLFFKSYAKKYYKCDLRKNTNGPNSDHRVNWPACGKYTDQISII
jgi:hypothetical protein